MTNASHRHGALLLVVATTLLAFSGAAQASGSFGTRYVNRNFSYTFREHMRKIFRDGDQSRRHYAAKEQAFYERLARALPGVDRVFQRARGKKLPLTPFNVTLPVVRLPRVKDVARVARAAYPLNLIIMRSTHHSTDSLEFSFQRAPRPRDLAWLVTAVRSALDAKPAGGEEAPAPLEIQSAYPAVCMFLGKFGLYVGANVKTDKEGKASLERVFSAELRRLMPAMAIKLGAPGALEELGVSGELLPVELEAGKRGLKDPCLVFNPHGPLVDGANPSLVRTSHLKGSTTVIVIIAPGAYDWGKVNATFQRWLGELLLNPNHERARLEQNYLLLADRTNTERQYALSELAQVREPRFEKLLSRIILDRRESESLREEAARVLVKFKAPRPYKTLLALLAGARKLDEWDGAVALSCRELVAYPRKEAVKALIKIRNNSKADWNTRNECNDTLSTMANKLEDGHPLKEMIQGLKKL